MTDPIRPDINWLMFGQAVEYYKGLGYSYVEVPYVAPEQFIRYTLPAIYEPDRVIGLGCLVGSAEQSLLALKLPAGSYVAASPCFRPEPVLNERYQRHFMKVELFQTGDDRNPIKMLNDARAFMLQFTRIVDVVETPEGHDLEVNGIEVGSYGNREANGTEWSCGTGLALPRFDVARAHLP